MKRRLVPLFAPVILGLLTRLICIRIDAGLSRLQPPFGCPPLRVLWLVWAVVFTAFGLALMLTMSRGDARMYRAVRLASCSFALYNLWPLLMAGRLWLNLSCITGAAAVILAVLAARLIRGIDRQAGWFAVAFTVWAAFELYLTVGYAVLN